MRNRRSTILAKPKVREAIRWLIDYQGLTDGALKGSAKVHQAFWPSGLACSLTDTPFHLDVDKAKALLAEAGYPSGFEVQIEALKRTPIPGIADSLKTTLGQAGIKATVTAEARKDVITKYRSRDLQIVLLPWEPDYLDPHASADSFARNPNNADDAKSKPIAWRNAWDIPEITAETRAAVRERDADKRCQMYLDLQKKLQADGALIVMFQQADALVSRANVKGFFSGPTSDLVFYRAVTK
jgi:peptide/nickel transport system substrate-binding protein